MALFNYATKEITLKIVYYGPGLSGKTTNLQYLHSILNPETKGRLLSLSTEADRTLFFDFLPVELGKIRDFSIRFQLYTVPGQVRYNATRRIVLKGADAVVFVADSQRDMREQNIESFQNMRENLQSNNLNPDEIPVVLQYNKRDLKNVASMDELDADLNLHHYHTLEACAINGVGVEDSFKLITRLLLKFISKKHQIEVRPSTVDEELEEKPASSAPNTGTEAEVSMAASISAAPFVTAAPSSDEVATHEANEVSSENIRTSGDRPHSGDALGSVAEKPAPIERTEDQTLLSDKIDMMGVEISALHSILTDIKNSVYMLSKEMKDLNDIKKEQEEARRALRDLLARFEGLKTKRRWFRF